MCTKGTTGVFQKSQILGLKLLELFGSLLKPQSGLFASSLISPPHCIIKAITRRSYNFIVLKVQVCVGYVIFKDSKILRTNLPKTFFVKSFRYQSLGKMQQRSPCTVTDGWRTWHNKCQLHFIMSSLIIIKTQHPIIQ